jgi:hypothetical protein
VGAFFAVYNYFRYDLSESGYAGGLELELIERGHAVVGELGRTRGHAKGRRLVRRVGTRLNTNETNETNETYKKAWGCRSLGSLT